MGSTHAHRLIRLFRRLMARLQILVDGFLAFTPAKREDSKKHDRESPKAHARRQNTFM